jgi:ubiquinone/menaquinone biosynthesis C-methylase UbiE
MSDFEKKYYESDAFWQAGMLADGANAIRMEKTMQLIPAEVKSLADIGCGNGLFGNMVQQQKRQIGIMAIDRSEQALRYVQTEKKVGDVLDIPLADRSYDCVTCLQVLEHIPVNTYKKALSELARVSAKYIIVSVPFNEDREKNFTQCPQCKTIFNSDLHLRSYTEKNIDELFTEWNFSCVQQQNLIQSEKLLGIETYHKLKSSFKKKESVFNSPICPLCGYENTGFNILPEGGNTQPLATATKQGGIKGVIKRIWPKAKVPGYWVVALYKRNEA